MVRTPRILAGLGLTALLAAAGCRSTRNEVPPGRPYTESGQQAPPIGLSTEPHPAHAGLGMAGAPGNPEPGSQFAPQSMQNYGAPTGNAYGPPDTGASLGGYPGGYGSAPAPAAGGPAPVGTYPGADPAAGVTGQPGAPGSPY